MQLNQALDVMSLQDLGSIGEIVGAVGVIVSLVYLALQVRQNTRAMRAASFQAISDQLMSVLKLRIENPDLGDLREKGLSTPEDLSHAERRQFGDLLQYTFMAYQNIYVQFLHGYADPDQWAAVVSSIERHSELEGFSLWWAHYRPNCPESFAREVDVIIQCD